MGGVRWDMYEGKGQCAMKGKIMHREGLTPAVMRHLLWDVHALVACTDAPDLLHVKRTVLPVPLA